MTLKGGTSQACASCKFQRRKCTSECPLAPYFPPDQPKTFQNAHKLFGVSKILKLLENLDPLQKEAAMRSIICQANIRDRFPVHGCWGMICQLHYQIRQTEEELHAVLSHLEMYRQQHHGQNLPSSAEDVPSQLELGMAPPQPYMQHCSYTHSTNIGYGSSYLDTNDATANLWVQQHPYTAHNDTNAMTLQSPLDTAQPETIQSGVDEG